MQAGKRDRLIAIERGTAATDGYGEETLTWSTFSEAWAQVLFGTGQERREAAQEAASQAATFACNWTPKLATVTTKDRIQFDGSAWDITSKALVGVNREVHFTAVRAE